MAKLRARPAAAARMRSGVKPDFETATPPFSPIAIIR
jgi:hypothetical protein